MELNLLEEIIKIINKKHKSLVLIELYEELPESIKMKTSKNALLTDMYTGLIFDNRFFLEKGTKWSLRETALIDNVNSQYNNQDKTCYSSEISDTKIFDTHSVSSSTANVESLGLRVNKRRNKYNNDYQDRVRDNLNEMNKKNGSSFKTDTGITQEIDWHQLEMQAKENN